MLRAVARAAMRVLLVPTGWITGRLLRATLRFIDELPPGQHGVRIGAPNQEPALREKVEAALGLIAEYDAERLESLRQHARAIVICPRLPGHNGRFQPRATFVELDATFVREATIERLAATLVHEGEHALRAAAEEPYTWENAWVVERGCIQAQLDFARRLPNGGSLVSDLARRLNRMRPEWKPKARVVPAWVRRLGEVLGAPGTREP
jgi:hypothetical protein